MKVLWILQNIITPEGIHLLIVNLFQSLCYLSNRIQKETKWDKISSPCLLIPWNQNLTEMKLNLLSAITAGLVKNEI